ncbi:uncharacterized protein LOC112348387 [Selaginella moellendorffii]|uniref:uncharacterized protein LOC112348387 n=1 Tax=Selaginella moellendorffii TaxID=88036 RepID=UPI000D1C61C0|nr:uncharacterized protein LOC112348387 [Selaginella moellendorffii]|eukprot:XP_024536538.1 uncharacterized protein LOC112348387 [Selaginella moellendorffii]
MASLSRGVSIRRQGSSGRSWADSLGLNNAVEPAQRFSSSNTRGGKGDGITKKTIMVLDSDDDHQGHHHRSSAKSSTVMNRSGSHREEQRRKSSSCSLSRGGGVIGWLKNRFRRIWAQVLSCASTQRRWQRLSVPWGRFNSRSSGSDLSFLVRDRGTSSPCALLKFLSSFVELGVLSFFAEREAAFVVNLLGQHQDHELDSTATPPQAVNSLHAAVDHHQESTSPSSVMASLSRGVSIRRQGSSGRSWADTLGLNNPVEPAQRFSSSNTRGGKGDGITKKTIMAPDSDDDRHRQHHHRTSAKSSAKSSSSRGGGVFSWLKNRFRKARS